MLLDSDHTRLCHMLEAAREAVGYIQGLSRENFDTQRPLQHSVSAVSRSSAKRHRAFPRNCAKPIRTFPGRTSSECATASSMPTSRTSFKLPKEVAVPVPFFASEHPVEQGCAADHVGEQET